MCSNKNPLKVYFCHISTFTPESFLNKELNLAVPPNEIHSVHKMTKGGSEPPSIKISLRNKATRDEIFQARFRLKGKAVYINEMLTPLNARLMYEARKLKKRKNITDCFTPHGVPTIKVDGKMFRSLSTPKVTWTNFHESYFCYVLNVW